MSIICIFIDFLLRCKSSPLSHRANKVSVKSFWQTFHEFILIFISRMVMESL